MIVRIQASGGSFRGAGQYYLHDKQRDAGLSDAALDKSLKPSSAGRVWFTETRNCMNNDPFRALDEMWGVADDQAYLKMQAGVKRGGRICEDAVKTLSLSWHKDDQPTPEHMIESADAFMKHMGWDAHQAVLVGHNDTEHRHIHIILNRVNPDSGRTLDDFREQKRAQEWALQYERSQDQVRCEQREINAARQTEKSDERQSSDAKEHKAEASAQPSIGAAANDHLPHNVIMIGRPHEQAFAAEERVRASQEQSERAELKADQRAEREAFFKHGKDLFKAARHAAYDEVRKDFKAEWQEYYKDEKAAQLAAEAWSQTAVSHALYFAKAGQWEEARAAFDDRDSIRNDVARDLADRKADLIARQKEDQRQKQDEVCAQLLEVRTVQYQELLQRQRDERAALRAGETLDALGTGREQQSDEGLKSAAARVANENGGSETQCSSTPQRAPGIGHATPSSDDKQRQESAASETRGIESAAQDHQASHTNAAPIVGPALEPAAVTNQITDLAAGALGGVASYLADQLGEFFAPTPPEVREAEAKALAKHEAERQARKPEKDDKAAAYGRVIASTVRFTEAERAQQKDDAYWKERDRGKGWARDQ